MRHGKFLGEFWRVARDVLLRAFLCAIYKDKNSARILTRTTRFLFRLVAGASPVKSLIYTLDNSLDNMLIGKRVATLSRRIPYASPKWNGEPTRNFARVWASQSSHPYFFIPVEGKLISWRRGPVDFSKFVTRSSATPARRRPSFSLKPSWKKARNSWKKLPAAPVLTKWPKHAKRDEPKLRPATRKNFHPSIHIRPRIEETATIAPRSIESNL